MVAGGGICATADSSLPGVGGWLALTLRDGELVVVLLAVAAFGENALRGTPSNCSIRALRFCETTVLLREDFAVIEQINPVVRRWLDVYILERDRKLEAAREERRSKRAQSQRAIA